MRDDTPRRNVPVEPPVHIEVFATHYSLTWQANGVSAFIDAIADIESVPPEPTPVVDATDTAGRERRHLAEIEGDVIRYVRLDAPESWSVSWERRTTPTISLSGSPSPSLCPRVHQETTDCGSWTAEDRHILRDLIDNGPGEPTPE
ncbi:MAG: hypothetical protein A07HR60_00562 [uncultured archaeon A07HR60]|nr:MAG: hypothetical protein J07HR59_00910 [Halorubrum sp. J07HR59]ESS12462.1 MAG: hypothetical protein A07HR60_00562 [uncultured archaeon A07HR60]